MKFKLLFPVSTALLLLASLSTAPAQNIQNSPGVPGAMASPMDPATGLPYAQPQFEQWIAADWTDPNITLTNVDYAGLPVTEIAKDLREKFKNQFDIVITPGWNDPSREAFDPQSVGVQLQLKNVTASEVFRAMNINFETQNSPVRWQLTMNGKRPLVLLRILPQLLTPVSHPVDPVTGLPAGSARPKQIMVYYVGDLIGDGGMTLKQIAETLTDINNKAYAGDIYIGFHDETELVIVKGTGDQIMLVHSTLEALKQKMQFALKHKAPKADGPK